MTYKKLTRSRTDRKIAGVCGGLGNYLGIDPVVVRILFILFLFFGGGGGIIYLIFILVVPEE
jgi:phage shock protein C